MVDIHPLKAYRERQEPKLSQVALAKKLGVARLTVIRWETGERKIDDDRVDEVARATGIPIVELRPDFIDKIATLTRMVGGVQ